jgi:hypothetical protein
MRSGGSVVFIRGGCERNPPSQPATGAHTHTPTPLQTNASTITGSRSTDGRRIRLWVWAWDRIRIVQCVFQHGTAGEPRSQTTHQYVQSRHLPESIGRTGQQAGRHGKGRAGQGRAGKGREGQGRAGKIEKRMIRLVDIYRLVTHLWSGGSWRPRPAQSAL